MLLISTTNHDNKIIKTEELIATLKPESAERDIELDNSVLVDFTSHGTTFGLSIDTTNRSVSVLGDNVTSFFVTGDTEKALLDWAAANA